MGEGLPLAHLEWRWGGERSEQPPQIHMHISTTSTTRTTGYFENSCVFIKYKARSALFGHK
jgi:hypothetical protein